MEIERGVTLGHYEIIDLLGKGGMGEVYRARDTRLKREVALKVLPSEMATNANRLARFEQEAEAVARLNHPHIVTIYSIETEDDVPFLTMELIEGESLDHQLAPEGLPLDTIFRIAIAVSDALAAAHEKQIVHRDLKPANILVGRSGLVKVVDFGLAKLIWTNEVAEDAATMRRIETKQGVVMGSTPYMSPEQSRGTGIDHRSDIFSLGIVLYELATGRRPFRGETFSDVTSSILRDEPTPIHQLRPELPRQLGRIISHCLEKDPDRRFQSARDIRNELESLRGEIQREKVVADGPESITGAPEVPAASSTSTRLWVGVAATLVIAASILLFVISRGTEEQPAPASTEEVAAGSQAELANPRSIAVLPFQNLSAEADNAFFAAGVHEDVLTYLSRIADLRVISRSSVMQYASPDRNLKEIAADLGVSFIVEGSVRRAGNEVRVTAQLIDARSDEHLWGDNFDRELEDVFAIQTSIAHEIVDQLEAELTPREAEQLATRPTSSVEAYDLFLRARHRLSTQGIRGDERAERLLEEAVRLDPNFALAYTLLAAQHGAAYWFRDRSPDRLTRMKAAIDRAFEIEPGLPEARLALADYYYRGFYDYPRALEQLEIARASLPNDAQLFFRLGLVYRRLGEFDQSIDSLERATLLDPANQRAAFEALNTATQSGRVTRAFAMTDELTSRFPDDSEIVGMVAYLHLMSRGDVAGSRSILDAFDGQKGIYFLLADYSTSLFERNFRRAAEIAAEPELFEGLAPGWGPTRSAEALVLGGFEAEAEELLTNAETILSVEVTKPYAETYAWPHLAYAENLSLLDRDQDALSRCSLAMSILPWEKDKVHGANFRQWCTWVTARSGKIDEALDEIELLLDHGWDFTRWQLALSPRWDFLRSNPRFRALATPEQTDED